MPAKSETKGPRPGQRNPAASKTYLWPEPESEATSMALNRWTILSLAVLLLGVAFWLYMGLTYENWADVGVYSIGITLVGFGVAGALASMASPRRAD